ncbi:helix-turn-helix transcriptional regulator [Microbispora sp. RL4-1S]|uniref:Helix-turn-helix transcriptional regulator n=1 Tax=Microbispora oryzae TaxID=2806554 RepID=A0A940WNI7_9ACTN|nr:helix-turn-helix transcriptional regulator [Microbispora oryzae]MBP2703944.1 helix-turn-helix transcriptional regulator [Microbispora oryzae]
MLGALGISEFDERVYRALLDQGERTVTEIAAWAGAPPSRTRHAMTRLMALGLVRRVATGRYQPVRPQDAVPALINRRRLEMEAAFTQAGGAVDDLAQVYRAARLRTDPSDMVEVLSGRDAVNRRVEELTRSVTTHMWVLDRPPYLWANGQPDTNETEIATTLGMIRRGVEIRSVYCPESMHRPGRFETVRRLAAIGEQARMLPSLPFKLRIMDQRVALVPLVGGVYDSLAVVHPSGLLDALMELFDAYWERAEPLAGAAAAHGDQPDDERPSEEDLLLLRMLKAGLKDQAIARQLGVSARTATRRISTIMTRMGAETRFQAGVEAAARGWL